MSTIIFLFSCLSFVLPKFFFFVPFFQAIIVMGGGGVNLIKEGHPVTTSELQYIKQCNRSINILAVKEKKKKKATWGGRGGQKDPAFHFNFLSFFFFPPTQDPEHLSRAECKKKSKLLNHLGKPGRLLLDARNYGGWKTTFSNSCKSVRLPPTDRAMISIAWPHLPVVRALGWPNPKRRAMQYGNGKPRHLGCRL